MLLDFSLTPQVQNRLMVSVFLFLSPAYPIYPMYMCTYIHISSIPVEEGRFHIFGEEVQHRQLENQMAKNGYYCMIGGSVMIHDVIPVHSPEPPNPKP